MSPGHSRLKWRQPQLGGALFHRKPAIALTGLGHRMRPYLGEIARNADHTREVARTLTSRPDADRSARQNENVQPE